MTKSLQLQAKGRAGRGSPDQRKKPTTTTTKQSNKQTEKKNPTV